MAVGLTLTAGCGGDGAGIQSVSDEPGVQRPDLRASGDPCNDDADCAEFDDGDRCDGWLVCDAGRCSEVPPPVCDSLDAGGGCSIASCDPATGECGTTVTPDGSPCEDGDACTFGDVCAGGDCLSGAVLSCPDGASCLAAACDPADGCVDTPKPGGTGCSDGDACTDGDVCDDSGHCVAGEQVCVCEADADCEVFLLDPCGEALACVDKHCEPAGHPAIECPDSGDPCQVNACDPATKACITKPAPDGSSCGGGESCSATAECLLGVCELPDAECDDGNACTWDRCELSGCEYDLLAGACDDGDPCTDADECDAGVCVPGDNTCQCGSDQDCAGDGFDPCLGVWTCSSGSCVLLPGSAPDCTPGTADPCVIGQCVAGDCVETVLVDGQPCDDGAPCTEDTVCSAAVCEGGSPSLCDDDDPCTNDSCVPGLGCKHTFNSLPCDDGNACTKSDTCIGGQCFGGSAVTCDAGPACTETACDPGVGCVVTSQPDGAPCDDGSACTVSDACSSGVCGGSSVCDCAASEGCEDDGDACNGLPVCQAGDCVVEPTTIVTCGPSPGPCQTIACDPDSGACTTAAMEDGTPCDAGPCLQPGSCVAGACAAEPVLCPSSGPCAAGSCDPSTGLCAFVDQDGVGCDDGDPCTLDDVCSGGACGGPAKLLCDDDSACTADKCTSGVGCEFVPISCDDGLACTTDGCDPATGCSHDVLVCGPSSDACLVSLCAEPAGACELVPVSGSVACDDEDACTTGDKCLAGVCGGAPVACDDGVECTVDTCSAGACFNTPGDGCATGPCDGKPAGGSCDDLDPWTSMDICLNGVCRGFTKTAYEGDSFLGHAALYRVGHGATGWVASATATGGAVGSTAALIPLPSDELIDAVAETVGTSAFLGLSRGWAITDDGRLWRLSDFGDAGWYWDDGSGVGVDIATTGVGTPSSVWASASPTESGAKSILVSGTDWQDAPWLVRCVEGPGQGWSFCAPESLEGGAAGGGLMALAGAPCDDPDGGSCSALDAVVGVDYWSGAYDASGNPTYLNYTYDRTNGGYWTLGFVDGGPSPSRTLDAVSMGGDRFAVVGSSGYVRLRHAAGSWGNAIGFGDTAWLSVHTGAWSGAGALLVGGFEVTAVGRKPILRTLDLADDDPNDGSSWSTVHAPEVLDGSEAGLWDLHGTEDGEIYLVGLALGGDSYYDAVFFHRAP